MENNLVKELTIKSSAFDHESFIPAKYTCEGENVNPPLEISGIPNEAKTLVLMVEDPDAPRGVFDHWIVWNIQPGTSIAENSIPGVQGENSFGILAYRGPCPPLGTHRYFFKVYALNTKLDLPAGTKKIQLLEAMKDHILTRSEFMGQYQKHLPVN